VSGIAGIFYFDGRQVTPQQLELMSNRLADRAVDGSRIWSEGSVGLVQCLFVTTSEAYTNNPSLVHRAAGLAMTADARVDNRRELATLLGLQGEEAQKPDEYFILKAYEKWGEDCTERILGDFAFAIWDSNRHRLFCARDPIGVKPFYYYKSPYGFIFASEIKAILALDEVPRQLNELCVLDYLVDNRQDKGITFFQGVSRLSPGCFLSVGPENFQYRRYWSLDPAREVRFRNQEEYAEKFLEVFTQAVEARLRSPLPVGCALSGGLDSSSVASVSRNILSQSGRGQLNTFSAIFSHLPESELSLIDESQYIKRVLETGGFQPHFVELGSSGPLADVEETLPLLDEPVSAPTLPMFRSLYQAASHQGVGVYLEGIDGDLVVSHGFERFLDLVRHLKWQTWMSEVRAVSKRLGISQTEVIKNYTLRSLFPPSTYQRLRKIRRRQQTSANILEYLSKDFVRRNSIKNRLAEQARWMNSMPRSAKEAHLKELSSGTIPLSFELLDKIASRCNIEVRYPFYDQRVIKYCFAIPVDQKLSRGWSRLIFRNSLAGILPEEIRWRNSKADFAPFFKSGLLRLSKPLLEEVMSGKSAYLESYLDLTRLHALYKRYISSGFCSISEVEIIYRSTLLAKWIEINKAAFRSDNVLKSM
jgi:asparagine synthase (glutamine-hydrolysing)